MNRTLSILIILFAVLFVSGCISEGEEAIQGSGLAVTSFKATGAVYENEEFDVDLMLQNFGSKDAKDIDVDLFQKSNFEIVSVYPSGTIAKLAPPEPELNLQGDSQIISWVLKAPSVTQTQTKTIQARISYDYSTYATTNIHIVRKPFFEEKGASAFTITATSSNSPVIIFALDRPPIQVLDPSATSREVTLRLLISNSGAGRVDGNLRNFKVQVRRGGSTPIDVTSMCDDVINIGVNGGEVQLFTENQERTIKCVFSLPFSGNAIEYLAEVSADYTYSIDSGPLSVVVQKQ